MEVWTLGDDIAWLHPGKDGRLYASILIGIFRLAPGTNAKTNRNAYDMITTTPYSPMWRSPRITDHGGGIDGGKPVIDGKGALRSGQRPAAHPNSRLRFPPPTIPLFELADAPGGVPISAIVFGGRRRTLAPWFTRRAIGCMACSWAPESPRRHRRGHGRRCIVRRDPMAMKPFAGYNFGDYWAHWINVGAKSSRRRRSSRHWFRQDGAASTVAGVRRESPRAALIIDRCKGTAKARDTAIAICRMRPTWTLRSRHCAGRDR